MSPTPQRIDLDPQPTPGNPTVVVDAEWFKRAMEIGVPLAAVSLLEPAEAERERIYSVLRSLVADGDCGCDQYCTCGQSGGCCHWYHMDPEIRHPGPTQDLLRAIVNGTDQQ